jgi:hypothetical protein
MDLLYIQNGYPSGGRKNKNECIEISQGTEAYVTEGTGRCVRSAANKYQQI